MTTNTRLVAGALCASLFFSPMVAFAADAGPIDASIELPDASPAAASDTSGETEPANPVDANPVKSGSDLVSALRAGKWLAAAALILFFSIAGLRLVAGRWVKWFKTKSGGYVLSFVGASVLALAASFDAGVSPGLEVFVGALVAGWTAAGGRKAALDFAAWVRGRLA